MLEWVFRRCDDAAEAVETPIGRVPATGALDTDGLDVDSDDLAELLKVDPAEWQAQLPQLHEHYARFDRLPEELREQLEQLERRLDAAG